MKRLSLFVACCLLLCSCASYLHSPKTTIRVYTPATATVIINNDTVVTRNNVVKLKVARNSAPVNLTIKSNGLVKKVELLPYNSFGYYYNILANAGIGMLVDKKNPKRFGYQKVIYVNAADSSDAFYRYQPWSHKGETDLKLSLPHLNSFLVTPEGEGTKLNTGFWGATVGVEHYYHRNRFIAASLSAVTAFFVPVPAVVDLSGEHDLVSAVYAAVSLNHRIKNFAVGYGLSVARTTWDHRYYDRFSAPPPVKAPVKKSHLSAGLIFPLHYHFGHHFFGGLVYRPTLLNFAKGANLRYEHLISAEMGWKIRLH